MKLTFSILILALACSFFLFGDETHIPIQLIHATNEETKDWGLMGRDALPDNQGLLIYYATPRVVSIWMYNVKFDLDVAFLNSNGVILEIKQLKAYPDKMAETQPINSIGDLRKINFHDPVVKFFHKKTVTSSKPAQYALEMNYGWFEKNHIVPGDRIEWKEGQFHGTAIHYEK